MGVKQIRLWMRRWLVPLCGAALAAAVIVNVPSTVWAMIGEQAVLCAAGLQRPAESVRYLRDTQAVTVFAPATEPTFPSDPIGEVGAATAAVIPPKTDGGGAVQEEQITATPTVKSVAVKNTAGVTFDYAALLDSALPSATGEVQVLIVHTHASESYMSYYAGYYNADDASRSEDPHQTVVAVGETIARELRARGIGVVHDTTRHDATYSGAYGRSADTVRRHLAAHPSIRVVLDVHRDAIMYEDGTKVKPTATVEGNKAAQVMLIVGGTSSEELPNPYVKDNLRLGLQLHQALESTYGGLMRPLYLMDARYNQELHAGSLLIEVGTDANTLSEALYSARLIGEQLAGLLLTPDS